MPTMQQASVALSFPLFAEWCFTLQNVCPQQSRNICPCYKELTFVHTLAEQSGTIFQIYDELQIHKQIHPPPHHEFSRHRHSCWPLTGRLTVKSLVSPAPMKNHLPQSSQHGCQSIVWLINSSCPCPSCPTLSHSITPLTATPPVWCPARFPSAAHSHPIWITLEFLNWEGICLQASSYNFILFWYRKL